MDVNNNKSTYVFVYLARIPRRVLEYWSNLLPLDWKKSKKVVNNKKKKKKKKKKE